jgi:hypothetical protein
LAAGSNATVGGALLVIGQLVSVFEVLDVDARSALSDLALERLIIGDAISHSGKSEILSLRSAFLALVDSLASDFSPVAQIRRDDRWLDVARSSERILSEYVHKDAA